MTRTLTRDEFARQFREFEHTTWKLEVRDRYDVSSEREEFEYWLRTGDLSLEKEHARTSAWHRNVRDARAAGKLWQRVRVVSEPLSDYIRWEHAATRFNLEAGEDIRWLPRHHPAVEKLPPRDFWLFDSRWVCILHFDENDSPHRYEVIDDPATIAQYCQWRDIAWHYAIPHGEYAPEAPKRLTV
ncbi:DUF6879 family protein [Nocardiopsis halotolerans]|uniref:DUF6879 family protein n=1 Tax=Nocardiopsis halotolerans TaxID=124252 RepID=UPI00034B52C9|nr:DUF6879 family protein [Nocardiopsis halotolerans]